MAKISVRDALKDWEEKNPAIPLSSVLEMKLQFKNIDKMDNSLSQLTNVEKLSLSTNSIDRIGGMMALNNLKILALGRNLIKSFSGIEPVGDSLEQLWISYNLIDKTRGIGSLKKLRILYISHNLIKDWSEFMRFGECPMLEELVFIGNPCVESLDDASYKADIKKRLPRLKKLDGYVLPE